MMDDETIGTTAAMEPELPCGGQTLYGLVDDYLARYHMDGLYARDGVCACLRGDLFPCGEPQGTCRPGYRIACDCGDHDVHVGPFPVGGPGNESREPPCPA